MKSKTVYVCTECDYQTPKWLGKCPSCGNWNTLVEETYDKGASEGETSTKNALLRANSIGGGKAKTVDETDSTDFKRNQSGIGEFDRVLGGGLVDGSVVLLAGEPGIGKSTLLMQITSAMSANSRILYVSGEESHTQLKLRADRLGVSGKKRELFLLTETDVEAILSEYERIKPQILVIDSVQTVYKSTSNGIPGSVSQVKECSAAFIGRAKSDGVPVLLVGHVNKEGGIAGPKVLEHMVDTVLYFEGERYGSRRIIRAVKNRFGSTNEIGVFDMGSEGLSEVTNPSEMLLSERPSGISGNCAVCLCEGTRPIIAEVQSLVSPTAFPSPRRTSDGIDYNRLYLIIAVLEKRLGLKFSSYDAYLNVVGGLRINDPGADLGIALALVSSLRDLPVPDELIAIGEIGLSGECRSVSGTDDRIREAARLGFKRIVIPYHTKVGVKLPDDVRLIKARGIYDAIKELAPSKVSE